MHAQEGLAPAERRALAVRVLPHIRFATMRPATVATYWHAFDWFRRVALLNPLQPGCGSRR